MSNIVAILSVGSELFLRIPVLREVQSRKKLREYKRKYTQYMEYVEGEGDEIAKLKVGNPPIPPPTKEDYFPTYLNYNELVITEVAPIDTGEEQYLEIEYIMAGEPFSLITSLSDAEFFSVMEKAKEAYSELIKAKEITFDGSKDTNS